MEGWRDGGMEGWRDGGMEGKLPQSHKVFGIYPVVSSAGAVLIRVVRLNWVNHGRDQTT